MSSPPRSPLSSVFFARLAGPTLLALAVAEPSNAHIFPESTAATVHLNGLVLFTAGLSVVLQHNIWCLRWPVIITALGWSGLALGLTRMMWPEAVLAQVRNSNPAASTPVIGGMGLVGTILCWKGYF